MSKAFSDWDITFKQGKAGEDLVLKVLTDSDLEVKTDYVYASSGNLFVDHTCWNNTQGKFIPSGIETTKSDYYCFVIPKGQRKPVILTVPTQLVKKLVKDCKTAEMNDGANPSKGYLLKVSQVFGAILEAA